MTIDSFDGDVQTDLEIFICTETLSTYLWNAHKKLKAYSPKLKCFLQFPKNLRFIGAKYICDARSSRQDNQSEFYRGYKGTIRNVSGDVVG